MSNFFTRIYSKVNNSNLSENFYNALDWLFDDKKFDKNVWGRKDDKIQLGRRTNRLTNEIKNMLEFNDNNFIYNNIVKGDNAFSNITRRSRYAIFNASSAICKEFIRHIRNSIAHSNAIINRDNIIFKDFDRKGLQTAYICLDTVSLITILDCYNRVKQMRL